MAEGLAAIGLAGNIIQFISFSFVLVSKTKDLHQSATGTLAENIDLEIISQDIRAFSSGITSRAGASARLTEIARRCNTIAKELLDAIARLDKQHVSGSGKAPTRWQSFRKALKSVWGKEHIEELKARLSLLRDQVTMHLVSDISDSQTQLIKLFKDLEQKNLQVAYDITAQIQRLDTQLQATQTHVLALHGDTLWKNLHDEFCRLSSNVHQASRCHKIIASLRYESMHTRQSAIKDAHQRTCSWIYNDVVSDTSSSRPVTGFTQWLQCGRGIYWITGKPGSGKSTLMKYIFDHNDTIQNLQVWSKGAPLARACFYFWLPGQQMQKSLEGLLQTLLYHILCACPELGPIVCPERWDARLQYQSRSHPYDLTSPNPWTLPELQRTFVLFRSQSTINTKFYIQIDGLDEYYGDSWDVIDTLRDLSTAPNVKLCLSSRPWNCFQDSFGKATPHMLRVHEFTRPDIELFARENLLSHGSYMICEPTLLQSLVQDIGERAQGVFLWVRLVVRSLRNGIDNEDPIPILRERLRTMPSDLEEFFEQILVSVEDIYRSRMAGTFLAAMRSPHPLKLIHYYFLDDGNTTFGFDMPSKTWRHSEIQERASLTQRRLNGRFKGLLETASADDVGAQTKVDFLHRTLSDFLATKRMRDKLQMWASQEPNTLIAISRALIAESKFIDEHTCTTTLKLAVELASAGALETGDTSHCFEVIDQAELENGRTRPSHTMCGLDCFMLRFAASLGHEEYLIYRMHSSSVVLDLDHILKHAIACPVDVDIGETYDWCLYAVSPQHDMLGPPSDRLNPSTSRRIGDLPSPHLVKVLFGLGADPNAVFDGASSWTIFASQVVSLMDGVHSEQCLAVLKLFLEKGVDVKLANGNWVEILNRKVSDSNDSPLNTLRYLRYLFSHGLDPNAPIQGTTLTKDFLRMIARDSTHLPSASQEAHHKLLSEFLRHDADLSLVYNDNSDLSWFSGVCQMLSHPQLSWNDSMLPRSIQYRILLDHGMDLNTTRHGRTLWESLLEAMHCGFQWGVRNEDPNSFLSYIFLTSLKYGAHPHVPKIQQLLRNEPPLSSQEILADMKRAVQKAIDGWSWRTQSRSRSRPESCGSLEMGVPTPSKNPPAVSRPETRRGSKRDREDTKHNPKRKRVRCNQNVRRT